MDAFVDFWNNGNILTKDNFFCFWHADVLEKISLTVIVKLYHLNNGSARHGFW